MPKTQIKDYFTYTGDTTIFTALNDYAVPWRVETEEDNEEEVDDIIQSLDILYLSHSGEKAVSPLIRLFAEDDTISSDNFALIIKSIYDRFAKPWARLWDVYQSEYNPLNNYDLTESEGLKSKSTSEAGTNVNNDNSLYGFASTKKVSADSQTNVANTTSTANGESTRNLTRSGNIGIRSNQELLTQEIELWKWDFFEQVFNDLDSLLALRVY